MLLRKVNHILNLYLCQSANWQCVVEAQDEESAATTAIEKIMLSNKEESFCLSLAVAVKKLSNNLIESHEDFDVVTFYSPVILANAGFHVEANNLHTTLQQQSDFLKNE